MKRILLILTTFFLFCSLCYAGDVYVSGYTRKDGTYVAPYHRSSSNNTVRDNYSYEGNTNPYTGNVGHNQYRNNPTSEYYQPSYQPQQRSNNYNTTNNYQYNQSSVSIGQTQTVYVNGQTYQVTSQSDGSYVAKDSYGKTYRIDGN
ncbi:MAG: hypothetical protein V1699_02150 [Candidatus Omnitrophota bacterium]